MRAADSIPLDSDRCEGAHGDSEDPRSQKTLCEPDLTVPFDNVHALLLLWEVTAQNSWI